MDQVPARPSVVPLIWYDKPRPAIAWLEQAFGFETKMIVAAEGDGVIHSELTLGSGAVYVVGPAFPGHPGTSPQQLGGQSTQSICLNVSEGLDTIYGRARAAGARIHREPADQPYGDRVFTCEDPEGHQWSVSQPVAALTPAQMAEATGRKIETP